LLVRKGPDGWNIINVAYSKISDHKCGDGERTVKGPNAHHSITTSQPLPRLAERSFAGGNFSPLPLPLFTWLLPFDG